MIGEARAGSLASRDSELFLPFTIGKGKFETEEVKIFQNQCTTCLKQANKCCFLVDSLWRADEHLQPP